MRDEVSPRMLDDAFAMIAEKVAADPKLVDAITLAFGVAAAESTPTAATFRARLKLPSDRAHAETAFDFGREEGFDDAFALITDGAAITARRESIQTQLEQEQETTDAG